MIFLDVTIFFSLLSPWYVRILLTVFKKKEKKLIVGACVGPTIHLKVGNFYFLSILITKTQKNVNYLNQLYSKVYKNILKINSIFTPHHFFKKKNNFLPFST